MESVRYVYFGDVSGANVHNGAVAVGYTYNKETKLMNYAVAFCNPFDKFVRATAHNIIKSRLKHKLIGTSASTYERPPLYADTIAEIIEQFNAAINGFSDPMAGGKFPGIAETVKRWVAEGQEFGDEDIHQYIDKYFASWDSYVATVVRPKFCGVEIPFWALQDVVVNRK